jgi:hypothetical protein
MFCLPNVPAHFFGSGISKISQGKPRVRFSWPDKPRSQGDGSLGRMLMRHGNRCLVPKAGTGAQAWIVNSQLAPILNREQLSNLNFWKRRDTFKGYKYGSGDIKKTGEPFSCPVLLSADTNFTSSLASVGLLRKSPCIWRIQLRM